MSDKDVQKFYKTYESFVGAKATETLIESIVTLATKAFNMFVRIKVILLSAFAGNVALKCGRMLAVANAFMITIKHIDLSAEQKKPEQSSTTAE